MRKSRKQHVPRARKIAQTKRAQKCRKRPAIQTRNTTAAQILNAHDARKTATARKLSMRKLPARK
ncbi:MAG: hypothetical protein DBX55_10290 [Verrucomicrobia bacterium]|nr:MAG: hypothetical protein DBX55_10290 [Verrucomicrobiota bacterium]